ncbi:hypothetical protein TPB0596_31170 [Tsukamurella pulmonis]|nr:hypothetical protein TPB0596_31170 [Tsukamurella pulmonis]
MAVAALLVTVGIVGADGEHRMRQILEIADGYVAHAPRLPTITSFPLTFDCREYASAVDSEW